MKSFVVTALLCWVAVVSAQVLETVDLRISSNNWNSLAAPKDKKDNNKYKEACVRVNGGPWKKCEIKRKGTSTWRDMGSRPSIKIKDIEENINFGHLWDSNKVTLNNDIMEAGYVDAYRVYRDLGLYVPNAYHAMVRMYKDDSADSENCTSVAGSHLTLADGPHRYSVIQSAGDKNFLGSFFGECTWAQWEIDKDEIEFKGSALETPTKPAMSGALCSTYNQSLAHSYYDNFIEEDHPKALLGAEINETRWQNLSNWHLPSLVKSIAGDVIIGHFDGPTTENTNFYIVRSTKDLECNGTDTALCQEGGLYYPIPHGVDQTFQCSMSYFNDIRSVAKHNTTGLLILPVQTCWEDSTCRSELERVYANGLASAHRSTVACDELDSYLYTLIGFSFIVALALPWLFFGNPREGKRTNRVTAIFHITTRSLVIIFLVFLIYPFAIERDQKSPYMYYSVTRNAHNSTPIGSHTSTDFDLVQDWDGTLIRLSWASALYNKDVAHIAWYYDQVFDVGLDTFNPFYGKYQPYPAVLRETDRQAGPGRGDYAPACSNPRNKCCFSHKLLMGANLLAFFLVIITSVMEGVRIYKNSGVWDVLKFGSFFLIGFTL